jgi:hypothetical protein
MAICIEQKYVAVLYEGLLCAAPLCLSSVGSIDKQLIFIFNLALHVARDISVLEEQE